MLDEEMSRLVSERQAWIDEYRKNRAWVLRSYLRVGVDVPGPLASQLVALLAMLKRTLVRRIELQGMGPFRVGVGTGDDYTAPERL